MQKMMTKAIEKAAPRLYEQDGMGDRAIVHAHYFSCFSNWDWYMLEYDPDTREAFGIVKGFATEYGYFSIAEFEQLNEERGHEFVERDTHWEPTTVGALRKDGRL